MNTYILYDKRFDVYKIGRSKQVDKRLRKLCIKGIEPYTIFEGDIEAELHERFKEYRINHPDKEIIDGHTEWFKFGGKFKEFIGDTNKTTCYYLNTYSIYTGMNELNLVEYDSPQTEHELEFLDEYYKLKIGQKLLILLGYIYYGPEGYGTNHPGISIKGYKILMTKEVYNEIVGNYKVTIVNNRFKSAMNNIYKGKVLVRRISDMWLIVSKNK